jgi:hypothetical protein
MTMTVLDRALAAGDAGQVTGERQGRLDPEVPERGRRRTFTAQYTQEVLAAYEAGPTVRRARSRAGRACIPA